MNKSITQTASVPTAPALSAPCPPLSRDLGRALETIARLARSQNGVFDHIVENEDSAALHVAFSVAATELPYLQSQFNAVHRAPASMLIRLVGAAPDSQTLAVIEAKGVPFPLQDALVSMTHWLDDCDMEEVVDNGAAQIENVRGAIALARELLSEAEADLGRCIEASRSQALATLADLDTLEATTDQLEQI